MAQTRNITLRYSVSQVDMAVLAGNIRIKQVLLNVISNGIKYNRDNGSLSICAVRSGKHTVKIEVSDTGYGIEGKHRSRIFQPFGRLDRAIGKIEGTGIGLVLSKQLVESMDGSIGYESLPGTGSTFWIDLPLYDGEMAEPQQIICDYRA